VRAVFVLFVRSSIKPETIKWPPAQQNPSALRNFFTFLAGPRQITYRRFKIRAPALGQLENDFDFEAKSLLLNGIDFKACVIGDRVLEIGAGIGNLTNQFIRATCTSLPTSIPTTCTICVLFIGKPYCA